VFGVDGAKLKQRSTVTLIQKIPRRWWGETGAMDALEKRLIEKRIEQKACDKKAVAVVASLQNEKTTTELCNTPPLSHLRQWTGSVTQYGTRTSTGVCIRSPGGRPTGVYLTVAQGLVLVDPHVNTSRG
jgi:hypothetical protein